METEKRLINVRDLYEDNSYGWSDYQPMVNAFGNVVIQVDDNDYQGDTRVLYDNDGRIGWLIFGWGSCSGCDALQACDTLDEVQKLCNELQDSIKWFDSIADALVWVKQKDFPSEWYFHTDEGREFVKKVTDYLSKDMEIVAVVRCRNCVHYGIKGDCVCDVHSELPVQYAGGFEVMMLPNDFCSYGERGTDGG